MKLFVDDVRTPPREWQLARTPAMAKTILRGRNVHELSMDYDLGGEPPPFAPKFIKESWKGDSKDGSGADIAAWMVAEGLCPRKVRVHSGNPDGAQAIASIVEAGAPDCKVDVRPWEYGEEYDPVQNQNEPPSPSPDLNEAFGPPEEEVSADFGDLTYE